MAAVTQDDSDLKRAAKDAITRNITGLIEAIAESDLRGIVNACKEEGLISSNACSNILDELTNATKRRRANQLVDGIYTLVGFQPKYLDTFLCVLLNKGGPRGRVMAIRIAKKYGHKLPMFEKKRANTEKNIKPELKVVLQPTLEISTEENDGPEVIPQPPDVDCPEIKPVSTPFTEDLVTDVNVILVTATVVEFCAVMGQTKDALQVLHDNVPTFYLGDYGSCKVAVIRTGQGSKKTRECLNKVQEIIRADYVIAVGICCGMKKDKVNPGDIIVAESIFDTSVKRAQGKIMISRINQRNCGEYLCRIFRESVGFDLKNGSGSVRIKFGPLVSEPTLVASQEYKGQILKQIPQALGGEMEGNGIMKPAEAGRFEGIVIKAVADYGDEDKEAYRKWQKFAATAAASYVLFHLKQRDNELQLKIPQTPSEGPNCEKINPTTYTVGGTTNVVSSDEPEREN